MNSHHKEKLIPPASLAFSTHLSDEEASELKRLEEQVEKNLAEFQHAAFQVGSALSIINRKKLYRVSHKTFEAYVSDRFGLSRPHAYSVMVAARTYEALTEGEVFDAKDLPSVTAAESIQRGAERLLRTSGSDFDETQSRSLTKQIARLLYELAVLDAPRDKLGYPVLSPKYLKGIFESVSLSQDIDGTGDPAFSLVRKPHEQPQITEPEGLAFDNDDEADTETGMRNWRIAELHLAEHLRRLSNVSSVEDVSERNLGHDLEVRFNDGRKIYVEVKAVRSFDEPFKLTNNEFSSASLYSDAYSVALVVNGREPQIKFISNPLSKLDFEKVVERFSLKFKEYSVKLADRL